MQQLFTHVPDWICIEKVYFHLFFQQVFFIKFHDFKLCTCDEGLTVGKMY